MTARALKLSLCPPSVCLRLNQVDEIVMALEDINVKLFSTLGENDEAKKVFRSEYRIVPPHGETLPYLTSRPPRTLTAREYECAMWPRSQSRSREDTGSNLIDLHRAEPSRSASFAKA